MDQQDKQPGTDSDRSFGLPQVNRRNVLIGVGWAAPTIMMSQAVPAFAASLTACAPEGTLFDTESQGRLLGGTLLGVNLDAIASVVPANAVETAATPQPSQTVTSPLTVSLLQTALVGLVGLGNALSDVLSFAAPADAGALAQFAYAHESPGLIEGGSTVGYTLGASGAVSDQTGAINFSGLQAAAPQLASISLRRILEQLTGAGVSELLASITDLDLIVGAVGGYAKLDSLCQTPDVLTEVERDYVIAYLRLVLTSQTIIANLLTGLVEAIDGLAGEEGLLDDLKTLIGTLLGPIGDLLGGLLGAEIDLDLTVNTASLIAQPIPATSPAALQIDFAAGTITLDLESLLAGGAYTGQLANRLNNLAPNSHLFVTQGAQLGADTITTVLRQLIVDSLIPRLTDAVYVKVQIGVLSGIAPTGLLLEGTLTQFLNGTATATLRVLGLTVPGFSALINGLLGGVGTFLIDAITTLLAPTGGLNVIFDALNLLLENLFTVLTNVVKIVVNEQIDTPPTAAYDATNRLVQSPRYHEAALSLTAVATEYVSVLNLRLGTGFAGHHTQRA